MYISGNSLIVGFYEDVVVLIQNGGGCIDLSLSEGFERKQNK